MHTSEKHSQGQSAHCQVLPRPDPEKESTSAAHSQSLSFPPKRTPADKPEELPSNHQTCLQDESPPESSWTNDEKAPAEAQFEVVEHVADRPTDWNGTFEPTKLKRLQADECPAMNDTAEFTVLVEPPKIKPNAWQLLQ